MEIIRYPCSNTKLSFWLQEPFIQISGNFVSQWQKVASCQCFESAAISFFLGSECTSAPVSHPGRQQCISQCQMSCCQLKIWVQICQYQIVFYFPILKFVELLCRVKWRKKNLYFQHHWNLVSLAKQTKNPHGEKFLYLSYAFLKILYFSIMGRICSQNNRKNTKH